MDDIVLVTEEEIAYSMGVMLDYHRIVVEGAAATGVAAVLKEKNIGGNGDMVIIISGQNVDLSILLEVSRKYIDNSEKIKQYHN
jgi:threonine dehydratase